MCSPIRQCKTGHSICDQCFVRIKKCPKCRGPKSEARSFTLEAIASRIQLPCRYGNMGCTYSAKGDTIASHEKNCRYGPIFCPFKTYDQCTWSGYIAKLKNHCAKKHRNNFYSRGKQKFLAKNFNGIKSYHYIYVIIHAYDEYFRLTWELDNTTGVTKWALYYMGTEEMSKKFFYKIEFPLDPDSRKHEGTRNLVWMSPCDVLPADDSIKFVKHNYLMLQRKLLNTYCDANGDLNYTACIYKDDNIDESEAEIDSDSELLPAKFFE
ncbi:hypothetical protein GWI33_020365 [Rhynchophorus ferrugineus]|uniref:RING-type E3 ubiquitin transferase n=1 Tax=Rhynchophorus ferrugineus TaxID=354439 RepID=A0A834I3K5_RHYFE|nr:hypothetical protein GWI33_020365 [Rhynchophorus ferrugineus]